MPFFDSPARDIGNNYKPDPAIGAGFPSDGALVGVALSIDGVTIRPQGVDWETPKLIGAAVTGNPFYQGKPVLILTWDAIRQRNFQEVAGIFVAKLNIPPGPLVTVVWPNPYSGVYEEALAFMEYPTWSMRDLYMRNAQVRLRRFGLRPEELADFGL